MGRDAPPGTQLPPAGRALLASVRLAASFLVAATLGWGTLLLSEWTQSKTSGARSLETLAYTGQLSLRYAGLATLGLALLHGVRLGLDALGLRGSRFATALVVVLSSQVAFEQADFLTSGASISQSNALWPARLGFFVTAILGHVVLFRWHLYAVAAPRGAMGSRGRLERARVALRWTLWLCVGLAAALVLYDFLRLRLHAYAFFAQSLLLPLWVVIATLAYRSLGGWLLGPVSALGATALCVALVAGTYNATAENRGHSRRVLMREGTLTPLTQTALSGRDPSLAAFDLTLPERFQCRAERAELTLPPLKTPMSARRNVVLISVDALRADALRWTAKGKPLTPGIRALERAGLRFDRATTTYPATVFAVGGALTGLSASQILFAPEVPQNVFGLGAKHFDERFISLPETKWFKAPIVRSLFQQGAKLHRDKGARRQTDWFLRRLKLARKRQSRTLAWIHYYEPHGRYVTHKRFDFGATQKQRYMSEVAYVDHQIQRVTRYLRESDALKDTLVILFADHGEALGERNYYGHHVYLNAWIADIPLVVSGPGVIPAISTDTTEITDVAPTVLHFAGIPYAAESMSGRSLLLPPEQRRGRLGVAEAFPVRGASLFNMAKRPIRDVGALRARMQRIHSEAKNYSPKVSVADANYRLIVDRATGHEELYDRRWDRREHHDLAERSPGPMRRLRRALRAWSREQAATIYCKVKEREEQDRRRRKQRRTKRKPTQPLDPEPTPPVTESPERKPQGKPQHQPKALDRGPKPPATGAVGREPREAPEQGAAKQKKRPPAPGGP